MSAASSLAIFFEDYDYNRSKQWLIDHESFLIKSVIFYVIGIFSIKIFLRDRKPFDLERPLIAWNAFLATFSLLGFLYTLPSILKVIRDHGISHTYTHINEVHKNPLSGYWSFLWICSKIPEFVDTFFIVLRKKPLMFMHWYHHALTGYFAFVAFYNDNAYLVWAVLLNYGVHAMMYSYYCLRAFRIRVPPQLAQFITTSQMVQFLIVIIAMTHAQIKMSNGEKVAATGYGLFIGQWTMWTYFVLWLRFYYISYYNNGGKKYVQHQDKTATVKAQ
ncbi:Elongation of very long chain fatty acids protein [Aphelenchoides besseyi]|nr:Elongation of very long chain fatty acids protein [Aphelenchoides besseyi]KAI6211596.1 Elongation of very long chain fatty acids protein [Aphelenchoides besseyi]